MTKPNLVLLHGWAMPECCWQALIPCLEADYQLHIVRLPGYGGIPAAGPSLDETLSGIAAQIPPQAHWLGWSLGGLLLTALAAREPQRCQSLILVAASPRFSRCEGWDAAMAAVDLSQFSLLLDRSPTKALQRFNALQFVGMDNAREMSRSLSAATMAEQPTIETLQAGLQQLLEWDVRDELSQLKAPVLALFGEQDNIVPSACAEQMQTLNNAITVRLQPSAGHALMLSHPRWLAQQMHHFISGVG